MYNLVYDPETGKAISGMERIEGNELARIKYRVKFAQRTPFRIMLTLLKLYRHDGLFIDPLYLFCCALETMTRYTWLEKTKVFPALLGTAKKILVFSPVRQFFRLTATAVTPVLRAVNRVFELLDKRLGISTAILPKSFLYFNRKVYKKQRIRAQIAEVRRAG